LDLAIALVMSVARAGLVFDIKGMGEVLFVDARSSQGPTCILQIVDIGIGDLQVELQLKYHQ
jgi:hypothetical protein